MRRMTYDITKHSPKKQFLQKYDFLFVWNANLIFFIRKLFIRHFFLVENRDFIQEKNLTLITFINKIYKEMQI